MHENINLFAKAHKLQLAVPNKMGLKFLQGDIEKENQVTLLVGN